MVSEVYPYWGGVLDWVRFWAVLCYSENVMNKSEVEARLEELDTIEAVHREAFKYDQPTIALEDAIRIRRKILKAHLKLAK